MFRIFIAALVLLWPCLSQADDNKNVCPPDANDEKLVDCMTTKMQEAGKDLQTAAQADQGKPVQSYEKALKDNQLSFQKYLSPDCSRQIVGTGDRMDKLSMKCQFKALKAFFFTLKD